MNESNDSNAESAKEIFFAALDQPNADARAAFLDGACGKNPMLRQRVDKLLADHFEEDSFLQTAAVDGPPTLVDSTPVTEGPGAQIDRYKLLQKLGEGGFGVVYMAEQKEPVKRRVALKIIKLGMDTKQVVARFEAERQALAMMDHPNIAKVLDAGSTETGRPYFVMELVKGVAITKYCDDNNLTTKERLDLFIPVCQAIQHAHQKGIIHRDIKPSNVMITLHDGVPVPKVIDFGIAKATQQELTEKTIFTQYSQLIGTPAYMSPEQAEMSGLDIDTRSDIYSLGVLLYELLVGKTPLNSKELMSGGYDEIRRRIKEEEAPKPSTRVNTLEGSEKTTIAKHRRIRPEQLSSELRGDLDWIVLKALEKDRTRRYETANGFVQDIKRFLEDEPVTAVAPSNGYIIRKYIRRHKTSLAVAATIVGLLVAGVTISTWQAVRATKAQRIADAERVIANEQRLLAQEKQKDAEMAESIAENAQERISRELYISDMNRAGQAYQEGTMSLLDEILARHEPKNAPDVVSDLRGPEWHIWHHASRRELATMKSPDGRFLDLAVSPDQRTVATVYFPGHVALFDVASRQLVRVIPEKGPNPARRSPRIAYSPDGTTLAVSGPGAYLRRWDTKSWQPLSPDLTFPGAPTESVGDRRSPYLDTVVYSPDGTLLAATIEQSTAGSVVIWDCRSSKVLGVLDMSREFPEADNVHDLIFSPDGDHLLTAVKLKSNQGRITNEGALLFWDIATMKPVLSRPTPTFARTLAYSPNGKSLVTGDNNGGVYSWECAPFPTSSPVQIYKARDQIRSVRFSPNSHHLAISTLEGNAILVLELQPAPRLISVLKGHTKQATIEFAGDDSTLWSAGIDGMLKVWNILESGATAEIPNSDRSVGMSFLTGGRLAWRTPLNHAQLDSQGGPQTGRGTDITGKQSVSTPSPILLYDVAASRELPPWNNGERFTIHAVSANGRFMAAEDSGRRIRLWDTATGSLLGSAPRPEDGDKSKTALLKVANDGSLVFWAERGDWRSMIMHIEAFNVWNPADNRRVRWSPPELNRLIALELSPDGTLLAASSSGGEYPEEYPVVVWDLARQDPVVLSSTPGKPVFALAFSPDGNHLACGKWDTEITLIEPRTGKSASSPLLGHANFVTRLAFSPDARTLYSGSWDKTLRVWDVRAEVRRATLPVLEDFVTSRFVVEPQGNWMVTARFHESARLWRMDDSFDPDRAQMFWHEEGEQAGLHGDHAKAQHVARQAIQMFPDQAGVKPRMVLAALAVRDGRIDEFHQVRREMLAEFGGKPYLIPSAFTSFLCTILPAKPEELKAGLRLAGNREAYEQLGFIEAILECSTVLGEYRAGHHSEALRKADALLSDRRRSFDPLTALPALIVRSMSQFQLGQIAEARTSLTNASRFATEYDKRFSGSPERTSNAGWEVWLLEKALLAEAKGLMLEAAAHSD